MNPDGIRIENLEIQDADSNHHEDRRLLAAAGKDEELRAMNQIEFSRF